MFHKTSINNPLILIINIPPNLTADDLMRLFLKFGRCLCVNLARNLEGQSLGFAFADFNQEKEAKHALDSIAKMAIDGTPLCLKGFLNPSDELLKIYAKSLTECDESCSYDDYYYYSDSESYDYEY